MTAKLLGQRLLSEGIINADQLSHALTLQQKYGGKLGKILHNLGACNSLALHQKIAAQQSLPFADLLKTPPDISLLDVDSLGEYLALDMIPWKRDVQTGIVTIATPQPDPQVQVWAARYFPQHEFAITSRLDIHRSLSLIYSDIFCRLSRERLLEIAPEKSARHTMRPQQKHWFYGILAAIAVCFWAFPAHSLIALILITTFFNLLTLSFKTWMFVRGRKVRDALWNASRHHPLEANDYPVYTILVPLYREVESLPQITAAIAALDYPPDKLDVKLVVEADDAETLNAAKALKPSGAFEIIAVPPSLPRTKPKACNYALRFARGEYLTIYDAEDKPDPEQLKRVLQRFRTAAADVVCVQCRLNYYNRNHNLLTRLFSLEYTAWFDYMLPALESLDLPIPLGGTSNHIALKRLLELGEWDPYNVTEDADLGIRMAVAKYRTLTLESLTAEEAPITLNAWLTQRSRWIKGYMQTWLVHMRNPASLYRQLGRRAFWGFQFFVGGPCLVFITTPFLLLLAAYWAVIGFSFTHPLLPLIAPLSAFTFVYGAVMHLGIAIQMLKDAGWKNMRLAICAFPFYWILHSLASFKGLWQLITRPHYWEKTTHGLTLDVNK